MLNTPIRLAAVAMLVFFLATVQAETPPLPNTPSANELAMLPDFCQAKMGGNAERYQYWNQRMGPDKFVHLHHYCSGLNYVNRANLTFEKERRRYYLQIAVNEFDYVVRNWPASFNLSIDAKDRKAKVQTMLRLL
jgi:hypothetical protein